MESDQPNKSETKLKLEESDSEGVTDKLMMPEINKDNNSGNVKIEECDSEEKTDENIKINEETNCFVLISKYTDMKDDKKLEVLSKYLENVKKENLIVSIDVDKNQEALNVYWENVKNKLIISSSDDNKSDKENNSIYIKISLPQEKLKSYLESIGYKMPIHESLYKIIFEKTIPENETNKSDNNTQTESENSCNGWWNCLNMCSKVTRIYYAEYSNSRQDLFTDNNGNFPDNFFSNSLYIYVTYSILQNIEYGEGFSEKGIECLMSEGIISAAFPLHDGNIDNNENVKSGGKRNELHKEWACMKNIGKPQDIDEIKDYFGIKIALYFAWLGYYTNMLLFASILGIATTLYGWITISEHTYTQDICKSNHSMCPLSKLYNANKWNMNDSCSMAKLTHVFDNNVNIGFTMIMTLWSVLLLKLWKRYSAGLIHKWGLATYDIHDEQARPKYLMRLKSNENSAQKKSKGEPSVPFWKKRIPMTIVSFGTVLLMVLLVAAIFFGFLIYFISNKISVSFRSDKVASNSITGAINIIIVYSVGTIYDKMAVHLTDREYQRTQTEYEDSLALKIYLFNFVNYYSSILYIAFFKGKFVGYPDKYNKLFGQPLEDCGFGSCYPEIFIQLTIILTGKKMLAYLVPKIYNRIKKMRGDKINIKLNDACSHVKDNLKLDKYKHTYLFVEYMEMVIQYGFVILFVNAYPIAPLLALINNMFEMRLDAQKYTKEYQRPIPQRVINIGIWQNIMDILGRISVFSNAVMIAFSSKFVPYMVYIYVYNNGSDNGFLNFTLSELYVEHVLKEENFTIPIENSTCYYKGFRKYSGEKMIYDYTTTHSTVLFYRLLFIICFLVITNCLRMALDWMIPDVPSKIRTMLKEENEYIIKRYNNTSKNVIQGE